jgi:threonine/homoserine/homoserine lactone efflux protein
LEVWALLSTYAPALFLLLAVVGAVNLALIAQQERRETRIAVQKQEARERRKARRLFKTGVQDVSKTQSSTANASPATSPRS